MDYSSSYALIIEASVVLIISFFFGEISKRTSIPSVLMLIVLGVLLKFGMDYVGLEDSNFMGALEILGIVGLIMIVLEAALELKLERSKLLPIVMSLGIALAGLLLSTWITAELIYHFIPNFQDKFCEQGKLVAWIYATPLSILSSAIIIPSVNELRQDKKEFHIYESTFSDILGIMLFYFLKGMVILEGGDTHGGFGSFILTTLLTLVIAIVSSYLLVLIFQKISSQTKLFLLISTLLLIYSVAKLQHLSSLLIILVFGLVIANKDIFFFGPLKKWLDAKKADEIYHGLHTITMETAFVVRTFFFVVFGVTIVFSTLASWSVFFLSLLCLAVIYLIRFLLLRVSLGKDIVPQLYIAPRGLITILLFYDIGEDLVIYDFSQGILLFIIIGTSLVMTVSLIFDKQRTNKAINKVKSTEVGETKWKVPELK
ncbi:MAG: cation:proton antiporter [Saprospiraceae bacterium]|nr:cation:proton antiporter [Saprospiraceae bacterium]